MYCDKCGTPFTPGTQYCSSCGKKLMAGPTAAAGAQASPNVTMAMPVRSAGDGRVRRNLNLLAGLWLANGILRLMEVGWMLVFGRMFFSSWGWGFDSGWPFAGWLEPLVWRGLLFGGILLGAFGLIHLVLAWSLLQRESWARILGIVIGFLALLRFPLGTALGIYTLWVLLPESSGREYDAMAGVGQPVSAA